ncbi:MAG: hypothetical protein Q7J27_13460 [Syntrophales bacterium]|nr:hypothetical protein [Syntrophales bacterium]
MKNQKFNTLDVKKCCENENKLGIRFRSKSKEYNGWFEKDGVKVKRITIPKGRKPIGKGLYNEMGKQLALTTSEFDDLLECPLNREKYEKILKHKRII